MTAKIVINVDGEKSVKLYPHTIDDEFILEVIQLVDELKAENARLNIDIKNISRANETLIARLEYYEKDNN